MHIPWSSIPWVGCGEWGIHVLHSDTICPCLFREQLVKHSFICTLLRKVLKHWGPSAKAIQVLHQTAMERFLWLSIHSKYTVLLH